MSNFPNKKQCLLFAVALVLAFAVMSQNSTAAQSTAPSQVYKGVKLVGTTYPGNWNEEFFRTTKKAIDMARSLPKARWNQSRLITTIIYDPPASQRQTLPGVYQDILGIYMRGNMADTQQANRWPAPIVIYKNLAFSSPMEVTVSLVGNGLHARDH